MEESRELIAESYGAAPAEVVFTAGGTECDNLAVKGLYWARRAADPRRRRLLVERHRAPRGARRRAVAGRPAGCRVVEWLPVDRNGVVAPETLATRWAPPTTSHWSSVMWANNEVGTVEPIAELAEIAHRYGVPFHSDAVQAAGVLPVDFAASGVDALTITGHKLGGPVGAGALLLRRDATLEAVLHGGGQERDVRSGTLDVAGVAGIRRRCGGRGGDSATPQSGRLAAAGRPGRRRPPRSSRRRRQRRGGRRACPGLAHLTFPGCEGDAVLMLLDAAGVECSTGSACSAGVARPSHVLLAMGIAEAAGPRLAAVLASATPRSDDRCGRRGRGHRAGGCAGRARPGHSWREAADEGTRGDVRRGRLRGGGRPRGRLPGTT